MQFPTIDIVSHGPWWGQEEQIASVYVPLMIGTEVSYDYGIPTFKDNPPSSVQVDGNGNTALALAGCKP